MESGAGNSYKDMLNGNEHRENRRSEKPYLKA